MRLIELQPCLDDPDRVRGGASHDARRRRGAEVHPGGFLPVIEVLTYEPFSVAVGVEVYGTRGHHADEIGAEAFEESAPAFDAVDGEEDLEGLAEVQEGAPGEGEGR